MCIVARIVLTIMLASAASRGAQAGQTVPQTQSILLSTTDFRTSFTFKEFDPSMGTLTGVGITLNGQVEGTAKLENGSHSPATVLLHLQATIALGRPDGTLLVSAIPVVNTTDTVAAFDGIVDFGGPSGRTHLGLRNEKTAELNLSRPGDLALFIGTGSISLPLSATALSSAYGSGNLVTQFSTMTSASATMIYTFTAPSIRPEGSIFSFTPPSIRVEALSVPEPTSLTLAGSGGIVLLAALRRGRARTSSCPGTPS